MPLPIPKFIRTAFAQLGQRNNIPETTNNITGAAGYNQGFGEINMLPEGAGGIPPDGKDMNGILFDLSSAIQYQQAGRSFPFNQAFANAIGGYDKGALVSDPLDLSIIYKSTINANLAPPPSAGWELQGVASSASVAGAFSNLKLSATGANANTTITCSELVVENALNDFRTLRNVSLNASTSSSGANGIDTGASTASTWYSVWVIYNGTTTAGLLSLSATNPTLPSGYTHKARVGWIRTDATANKYPLSFRQLGRSAQYVVAAGTNVPSIPIMASGTLGNVTTPTWSPVSIVNFTPITATKIRVSLGGGSGSTVSITAPNNQYSGYSSVSNPPPMSTNASQQMTSAEFVIESPNMYYASTSAAQGFLTCLGWEDQA